MPIELPQPRPDRHPLTLGAAAALCALGLAAPAAQADGANPYWVGVYEQLSHDSNTLRAPGGQEQANTISDTGLRLGLDQPMGRDRLHGTLGLDANRYSQQSTLNHTSYRGDLGFDWSAPERWSGELGVDASQQIFRYDLSTSTRSTDLVLERNRHAFARARVGAVTLWTFEIEADASTRDYSTTQFEGRNLDRHYLGLGTRYQPSPDLRLGLSARTGGGKYPKLGTGDRFDRDELRLSTFWQASGASSVDAYLAWANEDHQLQTSRSTSYWLGTVRWRWQPTGKLELNARASRDSDAGASEAGAVSADARLSTTLELSAQWRPTAKLQVDTSVRRSQRRLDSSFVLLPGNPLQAKDVTEALSLGLIYRPIYSVDLGCTVSRERRSVVSGQASGLSYDYGVTVAGCSAQYLWR